MENNRRGYLKIDKDIHNLRLKSTINAIKTVSFENFLKEHFNPNIEATPSVVFQNVILGTMMAVEYGFEEGDKEVLSLADLLIVELEKEDTDEERITLGRLFAKLIRKFIRLGEAKMPLGGIAHTFEYKGFCERFKEMLASVGKKPNNEFYKSMGYYSNN